MIDDTIHLRASINRLENELEDAKRAARCHFCLTYFNPGFTNLLEENLPTKLEKARNELKRLTKENHELRIKLQRNRK